MDFHNENIELSHGAIKELNNYPLKKKNINKC